MLLSVSSMHTVFINVQSMIIFVLRGGRLFHQWIVDQYAKYEQNNLRFLTRNQEKLRADVYQGLEDVVTDRDAILPADCSEIGKRIVLPSSFVNGPRYM